MALLCPSSFPFHIHIHIHSLPADGYMEIFGISLRSIRRCQPRGARPRSRSTHNSVVIYPMSIWLGFCVPPSFLLYPGCWPFSWAFLAFHFWQAICLGCLLVLGFRPGPSGPRPGLHFSGYTHTWCGMVALRGGDEKRFRGHSLCKITSFCFQKSYKLLCLHRLQHLLDVLLLFFILFFSGPKGFRH